MSGLGAGLLDALFPPRCAICSTFLRDGEPGGFCTICRDGLLPLLPPWCERCGLPLAGGPGEGSVCSRCEEDPPPLEAIRAHAAYGGVMEQAIHRFKFDRERRLARPLAELLIALPPDGIEPADIDLIVPVPLHPRRLRSRGFNQSLLLGRLLARVWQRPLAVRLLLRTRDTPAQSSLDAQQRRENLKGAFELRRSGRGRPLVEGARVLLLDDVVTTGSTLAGCARPLLAAGAASVSALALARALPGRSRS